MKGRSAVAAMKESLAALVVVRARKNVTSRATAVPNGHGHSHPPVLQQFDLLGLASS